MKIIVSLLLMLVFFSQTNCQQITWTAPETLSSVGVDASEPQVGIDLSGDVVAVWLENGDVFAKNRVGGVWSDASNISNTTTAFSPALVVDVNGNATTIWLDAGVIKSASMVAGAGWDAPVVLSQSTASEPVLAVGLAGDIVAVWIRDNGVTTVTESTTKLVGMEWSGVIDTLSTISGASAPQVAVGSGGHVCAVWNAMLNGTHVIIGAQKEISVGNWTLEQTVSSANLNCVNPFVAVNPSGMISVIWYKYDVTNLGSAMEPILRNSGVCVQGALKSFSGNWAYPVDLSFFQGMSWGLGDPTNLLARVVIDDQVTLGIWPISFNGYDFYIQCLEIDLITNTSIPNDIAASLYSNAADLGLDVGGNVVVAYMLYDQANASVDVYCSETDGHAAFLNYWSSPIKVSNGGQNTFPRLATSYYTNPNNMLPDVRYANAVWTHFDGTNTMIQSATGTATVLSPPTQLAVSQSSTSFGTFIDFTNTFNWAPSISENIAGYTIYRNGVNIMTVASTVTSFVDHNQIDMTVGETQYGIAAVDQNFDQSVIVEITIP